MFSMGLFSKAKETNKKNKSDQSEKQKRGLLLLAKIKRKNKVNHFIRACNIILATFSRYSNDNSFSDEKLLKKLEWFDYQIEAMNRELKNMNIEHPKSERLSVLLKYFLQIKIKKDQNIKDAIIEQNLKILQSKKENKNVQESALLEKASKNTDPYKNYLNQLSINIIQYKEALEQIKKNL